MYQIRFGDSIIYDPRDEDLVLLNPRCKLEVNTVGEGSFTVLPNHPCYGEMKKLKSIFEIRQDDEPIFRGRMTNDSRDFYTQLDVDLEGVLGFTNDSIVPPFNFPNDFPDAAASANVVEYFLRWLIENQHNGQVSEWQKLKVGVVTVTDPNNYITRASEGYMHTWDVLREKLFESALGGYLCIRYEEDGNYIDYLSEFTETNAQQITFGENLLDFRNDSDANETYSAILPLGVASEGGARLTIESLPDGALNDDLVKKGKFIYSKSAVAEYGWICVPVEESTWDDVTTVEALRSNGISTLTGGVMLFADTIELKAVDLRFSPEQIQSFRIYKNIIANSPRHGLANASYPLTILDIDIQNPQNTQITIGATARTYVDINSKNQNKTTALVEQAAQQTNSVGQNLQVQLTYLDADTKDLQEQVKALQEDVAYHESDISGLKQQDDEFSTDIGDLQEQTAALEEDMAAILDSVVEVGTSDLWAFRRWASGLVECWAIIPAENVEGLVYPFTFAADPCIQITDHDTMKHYFIIGTMAEETTE